MTQQQGFDVKYDRDGNVVTPPPIVAETPQPEVEAAAPEVEQIEAVDQEAAAPEYDHDHVEEPVAEETPTPKKLDNASNIRILRERAERAERAERERDEALKYIREMQNPQKQAQAEAEEDYSINLKDDDLAEGKDIAKIIKRVNYLEKELKKSQQQSSQMTVETRLKMQYPDIEQVLSQENISRLRDEEPELAYTISMNPDLYSQSVTAYKQIKKLGIHKDTSYDAEKEIIKKNVAKPKPVISLNPQQGESPLSRANAFAQGLTPELKKQLAKEMADIRRSS